MPPKPLHPDELLRVEARLRELRGPAQARTCAQIAEECGTTERKVQLAVAALRDAPLPVGSDGHGYYWIVEPREVRRVANSLTRRAIGQLRRGLRLRRAALDLAGQRHVVPDAVPVAVAVDVEPNGQLAMWRER